MIGRRGFTLTEALLALALFLMALGILSSLLGDFALFQRRFFREQNEVNQAPQILDSVGNELWMAQSVVSPTTGQASALELARIPDQTIRQRELRAAPVFPDIIWQTQSVGTQTVRYDLSNGQMRRSFAGQTSLEGAKIELFSVTRTNQGAVEVYELQLRVQDGQRLKDWTSQVVKNRAW